MSDRIERAEPTATPAFHPWLTVGTMLGLWASSLKERHMAKLRDRTAANLQPHLQWDIGHIDEAPFRGTANAAPTAASREFNRQLLRNP